MINLRKATLCLLVLPFVLLLSSSPALGQEGCIVPTIPENVKGIEKLLALQWDPANPDEIQPNTSAKVMVTGGSPPLAWSVFGTGFSLEKVQGQDSVDHERSKLLKASATACGTATISVTDKCGDSVTGYVRCTNGQWVLIEDILCGTLDGGACDCHSNYYCTQGGYRYLDSWLAGNLMGTRWHPTGNCTKYPCTPYDRDYCYCVGFYPKKYHVGIHYKKKWRWDCP